MDIRSLVDRSDQVRSPGNASNSSRTSNSSRARDEAGTSARTLSGTGTSTPSQQPAMPVEVPRQFAPHHHYNMQQQSPYPTSHYTPHPGQPYPPMQTYAAYPTPGPHQRLPPPISIAHATSNKRLAPPHPAESPAKKKQSKWTGDEDALIIQLRGGGMKWEDISKHLPGRSAISCRLRFQNYLERRAEWDEERKNKLARLYERFKKDMWEKIAKEMQLPWRAAENMHWQIGEIEMAQRANVPVFHTAGQASSSAAGGIPDRTPSTSPPSQHTHTHNHSLPQIPLHAQPPSPPIEMVQGRHNRRNSAGTSPLNGHHHRPGLRRRADSARAVPTISSATSAPSRPLLPPVGELARPGSGSGPSPMPVRYSLPPVVTSSGGERR